MNSKHIPAPLVRLVKSRAGDVCEYCRIPQSSQEAIFHVDHIIPRTAGGATVIENLALACVSCSLRKAARTRVADPSTGTLVPLFNPRTDRWLDHFVWTSAWLVRGKTGTGRATVVALKMNRPAIIAIRSRLADLGEFPGPRRRPR
jgi:hypothetical protein